MYSQICLATGLLFSSITSTVYEGDLYQNHTESALGQVRTSEEAALISHVKMSIANAKNGISKIDNPEILAIDGMSTSAVRHFLNNLCSLPHCRYLEIGVWKGSTWIAALYNNDNIAEAVAIDNWSQFGSPSTDFTNNCGRFLDPNRYTFVDEDSFKLNPNALFKTPVNVYFYDGCHLKESQKKAFTYYNEIFDHTFIAVIDDWSSEMHRSGTYQAFDELGYEILFEESLPAGQDQFWNGQYVAVIRKK